MLIEQIAQYGASQATSALSEEVLHYSKRAFLDWLSAMYPGTQVSPCPELLAANKLELGSGRSSLPGLGTTTFASTAAWINGSVSHAIEFDDIFKDAVYHPGCPTIAAGLAVAEEQDSSGLDLLRAIVVGYEISTRIGAAVQPSHYRFFHTTGTVGCFGGAAAVAALAAPGNALVMQHALATSATFASGLQQAFRSDAMTKALHAGNAASVGVRAGVAAAHGLTGVPNILEGEVGFGAALSVNPNWEIAVRDLGKQYNITRITQKNHGCCGHTFAAIDAALTLRAQGITPEQIESIHVDGYKATIDVTGNMHPTTPFEGKFSLAYVVCHALLYGAVRIEAFSPERLKDPAIRTLMKRLTLAEDKALTASFPQQRAARVTIVTKSGQTVEHFAPYRKGDPEDPLTDAELNDKFDELSGPIIGAQRCKSLREAVWRLDTLQVRDLALASDPRRV